MTRTEEHFDAMLRQLGAAYYHTMYGRGTAADVARALGSAEAADRGSGETARFRSRHRSGRWRISDVMTTDVVTVTRDTSYKEVVRIMTERKVNALPVVSHDGRVLGMVSEADVLRKEERAFGRLVMGLPLRTRRERAQARALNAGQLMTSPAITTHPDAPLGAAARLMNGHRIRRLPVVDLSSGELVGIVSRRDLLSVFLRPDDEIAAEVHGVLTGILMEEPDGVTVTVKNGVVILSGIITRQELIPVAERLASEVDGVVSVTCRLTAQSGAAPAPAGREP